MGNRVLQAGASSEGPGDVTTFTDEMQHANANWQLNIYGRAMHGFTHKHAVPGAIVGVAYDRLADERSFRAAHTFLTACETC